MAMTIPQRILFHVALGAGLVIAVATAVTYGIVYSAAKQRDLRQLEIYVSERSRREENGFKQVEGRLETDRMTFNPAALEFRTFCQRLCEEIESATGKRCPIELQMDGTPDYAQSDEGLLRHIFANLLSNAVKYSPPDQPVQFMVRREDGNAICRVADHGCGIPAPDQKRLFQAFHRGSNVRQIPGTGLGLLIVQRCVALHQGEIRFESIESQGTTFTVRLPLFSLTPTPV